MVYAVCVLKVALAERDDCLFLPGAFIGDGVSFAKEKFLHCRWDYHVTTVFKNAAIANDNFDSSAIIKQLCPDQETYKKEEQRRFEILDAH